MLSTGSLYTLTVGSGNTESNELDIEHIGSSERIVVQSPSAVDGTADIEVTLDGSTWVVLNSDIGTSAVVTIDNYGFAGIRIALSTSATADRAFFLRRAEEYC